MRKTINKIVSGLITLTLLLSLTPVAIFAEENVDKQPVETTIVETTKETKSTKSTAKSSDSKEEDKNTKSIPKDEETPTTEAKKDVEEPPKSEKEAVKETEKKVAETSKESEETTAPTKETAENTEESKETEATTTTVESTETTKETEATEPSSETAAPTESTEPSASSEETKPSDETEPTESTELTESSDETEPTESTDETEPTESTDETEPSESTEETEPEVDSIVKATSAKEYLELVGKLPDGDRLIVETKADLHILKPKAAVYFAGLYTLVFNTDEDFARAIRIVSANHYSYLKDAAVTLCGTGNYSITKIANTATVDGKKIVIIDSGVNGANESYSVIGEDTSDKFGHGTQMAKLVKQYAPDAKIISIKAINDGGKGTIIDVYNAVQFAANLKPDVILMAISIKDKPEYSEFKDLINDIAKDTVIVASAGNNNTDAINYLPAGIENVLTIGAVTDTFYKTNVSNYGYIVDYYTVASSTSNAAAIFAGKLLAHDTSNVFTNYNGTTNGAMYVSTDDDIYFTTDKKKKKKPWPAKLILNEKDITRHSTNDFRNKVLAKAEAICDNQNYYYTQAYGTGYGVDCIGFANRSWFYALDALNYVDKDKHTVYTSKYEVNDRRAKIYKGNNAESCSAWAWRCNISTDPSKSSKAKYVNSRADAAKYLQSYGHPGDIILYGVSGNNGWYHAAIYAGDSNGSTYHEYAARGVMDDRADDVKYIEKKTSSFNNINTNAMLALNADNTTGLIKYDAAENPSLHKARYILVFYAKGAQKDREIRFVKKSTCTKDLGNSYDLEGTTYKCFTDESCTTPYEPCPQITFGEDGKSDDTIDLNTYPLPITFYVKETNAGAGYELDPHVYKVTIEGTANNRTHISAYDTNNGWDNDPEQVSFAWSGTTILTITFEDAPISDPLTMRLQKVDNSGKPVNGATFSGAKYRLEYYDADLDETDENGNHIFEHRPDGTDDGENGEAINDNPIEIVNIQPKVIYDFTFNSTELKFINFETLQQMTAVGGSDKNFFKNIGNDTYGDFPLGTIRLYEVEAPDGYSPNNRVLRIRIFQTEAGTADVEISDEGTGAIITDSPVWDYSLNDSTHAAVIRAQESPKVTRYSLTKKIDANGFNVAGFNFEIYDTSKDPKLLVATGTSEADGKVKWLYKAEGWKSNNDPSETLTGTYTYELELPIGPDGNRITYEVNELKSSLVGKTRYGIPITWLTPTVANKTITEETAYYSISESFTKNDETIAREFKNIPETTELTIRKIDASNENVSRTFTFNVYWLGNGTVADNSKKTQIETTKPITITTTTTGSGSITIENLPLGWYQVEEVNSEGDWVVTYPGPSGAIFGGTTNGSSGTIDVLNKVAPSIGTTLTDTTTDEHITSYGDEITLVDKVTYKGLTSGHYVVTGVLYDRSTEKPFELNGEKLTGSAEFDITPVLGAEGYEKQQSGSVNVEFKFKLDKSLMNKKLVAFEELHLTTAEGELIAEHKKINEDFQTVNVPEVQTTAKDKADGDKMVDGTQKSVTVVDSVAYKNLLIGKTYTITGKLAVKKDYKEGEEIEYVKNADGSIVTATDTFEATESDGTRDLEFTFDASVYAGYQVVVFEDLYYNDILIMAHEDLEDDQQTIETSLLLHVSIEKADGDNTAYKLKNAEITIYRIKLDKDGKLTKQFKDLTSKDIAKDAKGKNCVGKTNDKGTVSFTVLWDRNYKYYAKETEAPYGYELCNDYYEVIPTAKRESDGVCPIRMIILDNIIVVDTGDNTNIVLLTVLAIIAIAGIAAGIIILKNKNSKKLATENTTNITETSDDTIVSRPGNSIDLNDEIPPTTD